MTIRWLVIIGLVLGMVLIMEGLWALDWAIWHRTIYNYLPWEWAVKYTYEREPNARLLGDAVNQRYYTILLGVLLVALSSYYLGYSENPRQKVGEGGLRLFEMGD